MKRGCKGCGSTCGVPDCRVCRGKSLCQKCVRQGKAEGPRRGHEKK